MKTVIKINTLRMVISIFAMLCVGCSSSDNSLDDSDIIEEVIENEEEEEETSAYAAIDFSNWKVTLPIDENNNGSPDEYQPHELENFGYQNFRTNSTVYV